MYAFKLLMAAALLTAPDIAEPPDAAGWFTTMRPGVRELAIAWEILDPKEARFMLARPEEFWADLQMLRHRYVDLAQVPRVDDCLRFPDRAAATEMLEFNRTYRRFLDVRQQVEPARWCEFQDVLEETDHLYRIWDTVRDARCDGYYVYSRRQALKRLREMIGAEAYYSGRLPPYVPLWRFQQID